MVENKNETDVLKTEKSQLAVGFVNTENMLTKRMFRF